MTDAQTPRKTCAATAGSASTTCAPSATARACARAAIDAADWAGKPVIGIINTWSDINFCHTHLRARAEDVKRGVLQAGGFPVELPAMSLAEPFVKPSTMLYRNLLAMETEELLRSHPIDGAVLMGGCDKTTPGLIMGAISMGVPAIYVPAGPQLRGNWRGQVLGSGSDAWKYWDEKRAGRISEERLGGDRRRHRALLRHLHGDGHGGDHDGDRRSARPDAAGRVVDPRRRFRPSAHVRASRPPHRRHGVGGPDAAEDPDAGRLRQRHPRAHGDGRLDQCHHPCGGDGAPRRLAAWTWQRFDEISREIPVLANMRPSGEFLMEDFFYAGGLRALMAELAHKLDLVLPHRHRQDHRRQHRRRRGLQARRHPRRSTIRCRARRRPPCSPAIWRRAAA